MNEDKKKALRAALDKIEKSHGREAIRRMGDSPPREISAVSTGSLGLDIALGVGGLPRGRVVEIYGPEASGKTTVALQTVASAQRAGGLAAFVDAEHALDASYAERLGVRVEDLLVSQPDNGEQALEIADTLVRSGSVDIVVVDSVAALTPRAEIEGEMGDSLPGLQARLMSQALRKLTASINQSNTLVVFINQLRMKIGVMFGNPETTTGGNALKFYSSVRLDIRRIAAIKKGDEVVGNETRVKVVKNKVAPPFRQAVFEIFYGEGVSHEGELVELGAQHGLVQKSGAWFSMDGTRIGQGKENSRQWMKEHPAEAADLRRRILEKVGAGIGAGAIGSTAAATASATTAAATAGAADPSGGGGGEGQARGGVGGRGDGGGSGVGAAAAFASGAFAGGDAAEVGAEVRGGFCRGD